MSHIRISEMSFAPSAELREFERCSAGAGAIVSFLGMVRAESGDDPVQSLCLEHFPGVTEKSIADADIIVQQRWALDNLLIIHRVGDLIPGDAIVLVCVAAQHRREAFEAADFLMDFLKTKAMFWKREIRKSGAAWIEPHESDYKDMQRWAELKDGK